MPRLVLIAFCLGFAANAQAETTEYVVIMVGNEAGKMVIERSAPDRVSVDYYFDDRGRGPDLDATYTLDEAGIPVAVEIEGVDYMKAPVSETLTRDGDEYAWQSSADSGRSDRRGFYTSLDGPPGEAVLLASALLKAPDNRLPILPQGEARLETVGEIEVNGRGVRHVEIHGLGFQPFPLWLDENYGLFAFVDDWFSIVPTGEQDAIERMKTAQNERRTARFAELAKQASVVSSRPVLIDNARIFDVVAGKVAKANAVLVEDGVITVLLDPEDSRPDDVERVDAAGRTLLPGLWDMHTHLGLSDGALQLAAGVTTVRDLANDHDQLMDIIAGWDSGRAPGPHVFRAGIIDGSGPFAGPTRARVENEADANQWIDFYAEHGYDQVKIYSSTPVELVSGMATRAHEAGMRVSGHIPAGTWAEDVVRIGYDEIQHINMIFLNFYKDIVETRNPDRFIKVAERGADLDPDSASFKEFVDLLLEHGTVVDPTVAVFMDLFAHVPGDVAPSLLAVAERLPPEVVRGNRKGGLPVPEGWEERYQASAKQMLTIIGALHDAGVPLVAGTDGMAGFTLQAELAYYQEAGISAPDILRLATVGSAEVMGVADTVGRIATGQRADLILVDGRPDKDINDIRKVSWVMKAGDRIDPAILYRALSIKPLP